VGEEQIAAYGTGIRELDLLPVGACTRQRTGLVVAFTFIGINGEVVTADDRDADQTFLALTAEEIDERQVTDWFTANSPAK
jgi:hypothetical protein